MKLGIIIICHNNEADIDINDCAAYLNEVKNMEICLVNNNSNDTTYDILNEIKEHCSHVSIVNINKYKSDNAAVKAGARFMSNEFNLKYLGFIHMNQYDSLSTLLKKIRDNQIDISQYNQSFMNKKRMKLTLFQSLFPVMEYLAFLNPENTYRKLNHVNS
jgi:hypothetical protein